MDMFAHSRREHLSELERRNELRRSLALPIGLAVLFGGGLYSLLSGFSWSEVNTITLHAVLFATVPAVVLWVSAVTFVIRSHVGYRYAYIPTAREIFDYKLKLEQFYSQTNKKDESDTDIQAHLLKEYSDNAHHNNMNNNTKSARLHEANIRLVGVLLFLGLMAIISLIHPFAEIFYD